MRECESLPMRECESLPMRECGSLPMRECGSLPMRECGAMRGGEVYGAQDGADGVARHAVRRHAAEA
jgi:hypothetical protein